MLVLHQVPQRLAQTRRDQVRCVSQEYSRALAVFRVSPGTLSPVSRDTKLNATMVLLLNPAKSFQKPWRTDIFRWFSASLDARAALWREQLTMSLMIRTASPTDVA